MPNFFYSNWVRKARGKNKAFSENYDDHFKP